MIGKQIIFHTPNEEQVYFYRRGNIADIFVGRVREKNNASSRGLKEHTIE